jgi:CRISPR-associated exonuclease Cas4
VWVFFVVGLVIMAVALAALAVAGRERRRSGLPGGQIVGSDVGVGARSKRLYSERYGLSGTPDYLLETPEGTVPVELKPTRTEREPRQSHVLQVLAYCVLVEDATGHAPPYGLLRYKAETFRIDYNRETRAHLLSIVEQMRHAASAGEVHRGHDQPGRCQACAYRTVCEESLA